MIMLKWVAWPDLVGIRPEQRSQFCCNHRQTIYSVHCQHLSSSTSTHCQQWPRAKSNSPAFLQCTSGVGLPLTEQTSSATSPVRELITTCTKLSVILIVLVVVVLDLSHVDLRLEQHLHHNLSLYVLSHLQHKILGFASKKWSKVFASQQQGLPCTHSGLLDFLWLSRQWAPSRCIRRSRPVGNRNCVKLSCQHEL